VSLLRTIFVCLALLFILILTTQSGMQQVKGMVLKSKVLHKICVKKSERIGQLEDHMKGGLADLLWRTLFEIAKSRLLQCVRVFD